MPALVLGGVAFQDFEIPESVKLGGNQAGKLWKLPGGVRIFDAQGPDDDTIEWTGRFRTATAMGRALTIDGMRRAGQQVQLSVLGLSYSVIIRTFTFHPARAGFEIVYEIGLIVLNDNTQGLAAVAATSIDFLVGQDIADGSALLTAPTAAVSASVASFTAAVAAIPSIAAASRQALLPIQTAGAALTSALSTAAAAQDVLIIANPLATMDGGATSVPATLAALNAEVTYLGAQFYFGRAVINVQNDLG